MKAAFAGTGGISLALPYSPSGPTPEGGTASFRHGWLVRKLAKRSPEVLYYVDTQAPRVALTIDDGPDPASTPGILDALKTHDARATFFLISGHVPGNEALVHDLVSGGHELGNHLTEHRPSIALAPGSFKKALVEADDVLSEFGPVRWFRPSSGVYTEPMLTILDDHGYECALASVYAYDAQIPFPQWVANYVLSNIQPGSIIVLHDGGERGLRTEMILRMLLPELAALGLDVVTLSDLVRSGARPY